MTLDALRWLVLALAALDFALAVAVICLGWLLHGCLATVRRLEVPSRAGDIAARVPPPAPRRP